MAVPILDCLLNPELFPNSQANPGFIMCFSHILLYCSMSSKRTWMFIQTMALFHRLQYIYFGQKTSRYLESTRLWSSKKAEPQAPTTRRVADRWPCPAASWHPPAVWSLVACPGRNSWEAKLAGNKKRWDKTPSYLWWFPEMGGDPQSYHPLLDGNLTIKYHKSSIFGGSPKPPYIGGGLVNIQGFEWTTNPI